MKKFVVLGGYGGMGSICVRDLYDSYKDCEIIVAGRDLEKARKYASSFHNKRVKYAKVDVTNVNQTAKLLKNCDVCINCVQYYFNLDVMKACLIAKTNYIDLGGLFHITKKQLKLHNKFKKIDKIAILGCGSTPGITNIMASYGYKKLKYVKEIDISFGDYDATNYRQPFVLPYSIYTIFDEYMLKPALFTKGRLIFAKPGDGEKILEFPRPVGKIKGFYTLHSELATFPSSFKLKECSFRVTFPEDFNKQIKFLIEMGLASEKEIEINNIKIKPRDFTAKVMDQWIIKPGTKIDDLEYLRVELIGNKKLILDCFAKTNKKYNIPAGSYNTGIPPSIISQFIINGKIKFKGVHAPEFIVPEIEFFKELKKRNIYVFLNNKKVI